MAVSPGSGKSAVSPAVLKARMCRDRDIGHHEGLDAVAQACGDRCRDITEQVFLYRDMERFLKREPVGNELEVLTERKRSAVSDRMRNRSGE